MRRIARDLEEIARSFRKSTKEPVQNTPKSHLALEIATLSERLDRFRELHKKQLAALLQEEVKLGTDLLRLESYEPRVFQYRAKIRDGLKSRLSHLGRDRGRLKGEHEREIAELQDRLFKQLRRHQELGGSPS